MEHFRAEVPGRVTALQQETRRQKWAADAYQETRRKGNLESFREMSPRKSKRCEASFLQTKGPHLSWMLRYFCGVRGRGRGKVLRKCERSAKTWRRVQEAHDQVFDRVGFIFIHFCRTGGDYSFSFDPLCLICGRKKSESWLENEMPVCFIPCMTVLPFFSPSEKTKS